MRSMLGTCLLDYPTSLHHLLSPCVVSEQQEIPRKHHGGQKERSLTHVWSLAPSGVTVPCCFIWSLVGGLSALCISWSSPDLDALSHTCSWCPQSPPWLLTQYCHQASSCHDSRSLWLPFLALGISASPHATHILQANQSWEGSSVQLSIKWTCTLSFLIYWSHSTFLWDKSCRIAEVYRH